MFNESTEIDFPSWPIRCLSRDGGRVLNHFLPGSISGLGMMWVICFGSMSLETSSPASSLQQMVTDCACKVVRLAAIRAHRTVFVLFLPGNTGVFTEPQSNSSFVILHAVNFLWPGPKWKSWRCIFVASHSPETKKKRTKSVESHQQPHEASVIFVHQKTTLLNSWKLEKKLLNSWILSTVR